jgi:hypothetical protein
VFSKSQTPNSIPNGKLQILEKNFATYRTRKQEKDEYYNLRRRKNIKK